MILGFLEKNCLKDLETNKAKMREKSVGVNIYMVKF